MKREVRHLYLTLFQKNGKVVDLKKIVGYYEKYDQFRDDVMASDDAPRILKHSLMVMRMPKFLIWAKGYFIK